VRPFESAPFLDMLCNARDAFRAAASLDRKYISGGDTKGR